MPLLHTQLLEVDEELACADGTASSINAFVRLVRVGSSADHNVKGYCALCLNCISETLSLSSCMRLRSGYEIFS